MALADVLRGVAARPPALPAPVAGPAFLEGVTRFLRALTRAPLVWGRPVEVTFAAPTTATQVAHGIGRAPLGYVVIRATADVRVFDATPPASAPPPSTAIYLQASAATTATLWVF